MLTSLQAGTIIFGSALIAISGSSAGGDVITITMADSMNLRDGSGNLLLM